MAVAVKQNLLIGALKDLISFGRTLLENVQKDIAEGGSSLETAHQKMSVLLGLMSAEAKFFDSIEKKKCYRDTSIFTIPTAEVRDHVESFLQLEVEWDSFLKRLDVQMQMSDTVLSHCPAAQTLSSDTWLVHVQTKENVSLGQYLGKGENLLLNLLEAQSVRVLVVSYGCLEGATFWLDQTGTEFDMLFDEERAVYRTLGLGSSFAKVMKFKSLLHYSELLAMNRPFPEVPPQFIDDLFQMGGDFVLDEGGKVIFSYRCISPVDRPSAAQILAAVSAHAGLS
ncbi:selenoprotein L [Triplophysa rosa]|uniref:Selenoprotein L n=1 Tax=Triplophysa rosa TaxID=992332 RepID=A0A9W7WHI4_TRIRA|nr:selenoprotein L [Triplophysa rosa]